MVFHGKRQNSFHGALPLASEGGNSSNCNLSYQNTQAKVYNDIASFIPNSSSLREVSGSSVGDSYASTLRQQTSNLPLKSPRVSSSNLAPESTSSSQQMLISSAIANIIPKLTSSLDWNVDLNIDVNSPEFIAMVSAAANHYAAIGMGSPNDLFNSNVSQKEMNSQEIRSQNNSPSPAVIETDYSVAPTSTYSSPSSLLQKPSFPRQRTTSRLNKFVRRLHDMLVSEKDKGVVEWRCGLLVLHSTDAFAKTILPKYFNTRNFKTFRRQLNYYGFVHVRSFSATGSTTTALWVNQELASKQAQFANEPDNISTVLLLKRVDPCPDAKTAEGRRVRKEEAVNTVEDIGINTQWMQLSQIKSLTKKVQSTPSNSTCANITSSEAIYHDTVSVNNTPEESLGDAYEPEGSFPSEKMNTEIENQDSFVNVNKEDDSLKIMARANNISSSCNDAANLLLNLSRSACVSP